jgi:hypothetical protein
MVLVVSRPADPIARLQFARDEIDRVFGPGYAAAHSDLVAAVMISASLDYAAELIAAVLMEPDDPVVPLRRGLVRTS